MPERERAHLPARWPVGRWLPALLVLALAGGLALLFASGQMELYRTLMNGLGGEALPTPFMDMHAVLSALQCHRQGVDVYAVNPCDAFGRVHAYSPIWLQAAFLPVGTGATVGLGLLLGVLFIAGLTALPPARRGREVFVMCLACTSSTIIFALERANNDLIVWLLVLLVIALLRGAGMRRMLGYGVIILAGLLKFYPLVLLALAIQEKPRRMVVVALVGLAVVSMVVLSDVTSWRRALMVIPTALHSIDMFGARNFPYGVADGLAQSGFDALWIGPALLAVFMLYAASLMVRLNLRLDLARQLACLSLHERLLLLAGGALIVGCFFTAASAFYRGIHLLFVLPALFALWRQAEKDTAFTAAAGVIAIVVIMWTEGARYLLGRLAILAGLDAGEQRRIDLLVWTVHELLSWWIVSLLGALLLALAWTAPGGLWVRRVVQPYLPAMLRETPR